VPVKRLFEEIIKVGTTQHFAEMAAAHMIPLSLTVPYLPIPVPVQRITRMAVDLTNA
jgi:hypothetical protein